MSADIEQTIDMALADWETSEDAMRWTTDEAVLEAAPDADYISTEQMEAFIQAANQAARAYATYAKVMSAAIVKLGPQLAEVRRKAAAAGVRS